MLMRQPIRVSYLNQKTYRLTISTGSDGLFVLSLRLCNI